MSVIGLERLARAAQPITMAADQTIVREGDLADGFYVVADGECRCGSVAAAYARSARQTRSVRSPSWRLDPGQRL